MVASLISQFFLGSGDIFAFCDHSSTFEVLVYINIIFYMLKLVFSAVQTRELLKIESAKVVFAFLPHRNLTGNTSLYLFFRNQSFKLHKYTHKNQIDPRLQLCQFTLCLNSPQKNPEVVNSGKLISFGFKLLKHRFSGLMQLSKLYVNTKCFDTKISYFATVHCIVTSST